MKRKLLGMLTPSSNTALEPITAALLQGLPGVSAHFARFRVTEISLAGAALKQMYDLFKAGGLTADERLPFIIGIITAGLVGYACIAWLLRYLQRATTIVFTVYRVLLGVIVLVLLLVRQ